jgi:hypothetical protein
LRWLKIFLIAAKTQVVKLRNFGLRRFIAFIEVAYMKATMNRGAPN